MDITTDNALDIYIFLVDTISLILFDVLPIDTFLEIIFFICSTLKCDYCQ